MQVLTDPASGNLIGGLSPTNSNTNQECKVIKEFLMVLPICHTIIPEVKDEKTVYQASSLNKAALVQGAELLGYHFHVGKF